MRGTHNEPFVLIKCRHNPFVKMEHGQHSEKAQKCKNTLIRVAQYKMRSRGGAEYESGLERKQEAKGPGLFLFLN